MIRTISIGAIACAFAASASAQTSPWTFEGVTFPEAAGWCPTPSADLDAAGNKLPALKMFSCGKEFPVLSAGVALRGAAPQDLGSLTTNSAAAVSGEEGKTTVDAIFKRKDKSCTRLTYAIDGNPVRNLPAYQVNATYSCPDLSALTYQFHNITAYAQRANGDIWVVAFDSEIQAASAAEEDLIRNAVVAINGK